MTSGQIPGVVAQIQGLPKGGGLTQISQNTDSRPVRVVSETNTIVCTYNIIGMFNERISIPQPPVGERFVPMSEAEMGVPGEAWQNTRDRLFGRAWIRQKAKNKVPRIRKTDLISASTYL